MEEKEIVMEYSNGSLTIFWKPKLCIHAAECVKALPQVYNPKEKPWIKAENATTSELVAQIKRCPSGALSFKMNEDNESPDLTTQTRIEVVENGPLIAHGTLTVVNKDGREETKDNRTAFCRCGASAKKPYCDGSHFRDGFIG